MKKIFIILISLALLQSLVTGCSGSKEGMHNRGVSNRGYRGY